MLLQEANWGGLGMCFFYQTLTFPGRTVQPGVLMGGGCAEIELCNYLTWAWWVLKPHQKIWLQGGFFAAGVRMNYLVPSGTTSTLLDNPGSASLQGCNFHDLSFELKQSVRRSFCSGKASIVGLWVKKVPAATKAHDPSDVGVDQAEAIFSNLNSEMEIHFPASVHRACALTSQELVWVFTLRGSRTCVEPTV